MKISNNFWAILVGVFLFPFTTVLLLKLFPVCNGGMECVGVGIIYLGLSATIGLIITCFGIYPLLKRIFQVKTKSKPTKPLSIFLGVILGIISLFVISFYFGNQYEVMTSEVYKSNIFIAIFMMTQLILVVGLPMFWTKLIDKFINR